jgi:hypothetical protein
MREYRSAPEAIIGAISKIVGLSRLPYSWMNITIPPPCVFEEANRIEYIPNYEESKMAKDLS